jgi:hypothetical protein
VATKIANGLDLQNQRIVSISDPSSPQDAASKAYVDNLLAGLRWKQPVRVASTANVTVSNPGTAIFDGITLVATERILLKNQSTASQNGIYQFNTSGTALTRTTDADSAAELAGATVFVTEGTVNHDTAYTQTAEITTLGTDTVTFAQFGAGISYTASETGIHLAGTVFSLVLADASLSQGGSGVQIASAFGGSGVSISSGVLNVGAGTGITVAADTVGVDYSVVGTRYSATVGDGSSLSYVITHGLTNKNVQVALYETTSGAAWLPDITARTTTTLTLGFATAPTSAFFTVVVE